MELKIFSKKMITTDWKEDKQCPSCRHIFPFAFRTCPHCGKKE